MNCEHKGHAVHVPTTTDETLQANKDLLLAALAAGGASVATVSYEGNGDSGGIEGVRVDSPEGKTFDAVTPVSIFVAEAEYVDGSWSERIVSRELDIEDALRDFATASIERLHGGYEDGHGGAGEVIFNCEAKTIRIEHNDYFMDSNYTETEL